MLRLIIIVLSFLPKTDRGVVLENCLSLTGATLASTYSSDDFHVYACLDIFVKLRCLFNSSSPSTISTIKIVQAGLIYWIEDKGSVVPDDRYNDCVR